MDFLKHDIIILETECILFSDFLKFVKTFIIPDKGN
jgi:hypothetical protein